MMKYLQKLGKAIMFPIVVLPVAAIFMGIGNWIASLGDIGNISILSVFLIKAGGAALNNIPILFAIGVACGMAKEDNVSSAVSGLIAYLMVTTLLSPEAVAAFTGREADPSFSVISNAFTGILSGLAAAFAFNKFHKVVLPPALAFFSGRRLVPIMTSAIMIPVSVVLLFVWPMLYSGLVAFGTTISSLGALGAGIYGFFNRLLIPTGLHHALNSVFWFDAVGIADITNFWAGTGTPGVTGMYQAGYFPVMMFGLPGAALAMYHCAKPEKKKAVAGILLAGAFASFFTGVTEPLEFSFMFLCPPLYIVHALLTGVSMFLAATFHWIAGFAFSAGFVDFILSCRLPLAVNAFMLIPLGLVFFVIYYVLFRSLIVRFHLKTPGREDDSITDEMDIELSDSHDFIKMAEMIYDALGGRENVQSVDNCATRLRLGVKDSSQIDVNKIKAAGAAGVVRPSKDSVQVIVGPLVEFVADAMKKMIS